eukprot:TRINITY_DN10048_c0_g1_i1.p1 TRINITY_DN10048_c0_g1~~TRINITY_DN10048_c0_g1_i1.p1  ORF type:complete len:292 (-),score=87.67 TRINITY_DN10048_c0_g1_i1:92-967(-)
MLARKRISSLVHGAMRPSSPIAMGSVMMMEFSSARKDKKKGGAAAEKVKFTMITPPNDKPVATIAKNDVTAFDMEDPSNQALAEWDKQVRAMEQEGVEEDVEVDVDEMLKKYDRMMLQGVENYKRSVAKMQLGSVSADMFDHIMVKAYGDDMPFQSVAQTLVRSGNSVVVNVHDSSLLKSVATAISDHNKELSPDSDGRKLTILIPRPTESHRSELIKAVTERAESSKHHLKRLHSACFKKLGKIEMPKDDRFRWETEALGFIGKATKLLNKVKEEKIEELKKTPCDPDII